MWLTLGGRKAILKRNQVNNAGLYGLVLCGGKSVRMGSDKGLLDYHGRPQREFLFSLLGGFCVQVFTSCRDEQDVPEQLCPLPDSLGFAGPMNGILSAFRAHPAVAWMTVAVDMPFVDERAIAFLLEGRDRSRPATCFYNPEHGLPEPLLTVWEASAHPLLEAFVKAGNVSPRAFLREAGAHLIKPYDVRILMNVNSPEERRGASGQ